MQKNTATNKSQDWHRADVVAALKKSGWSLSALGRAHGLSSNTLKSALSTSYPKAERIIAEAIGVDASDIWPERVAARNFKPALLKVSNG